jgi:hypothetical protein
MSEGVARHPPKIEVLPPTPRCRPDSFQRFNCWLERGHHWHASVEGLVPATPGELLYHQCSVPDECCYCGAVRQRTCSAGWRRRGFAYRLAEAKIDRDNPMIVWDFSKSEETLLETRLEVLRAELSAEILYLRNALRGIADIVGRSEQSAAERYGEIEQIVKRLIIDPEAWRTRLRHRMDRHYRALALVDSGDLTPEEALRQAREEDREA